MNHQEAKNHGLTLLIDTSTAADLITYNNGPEQIPAVFDFHGKIEGVPAETAILYVKTADVPKPDYRDTFVRNGKTWRIYQDPSSGSAAVDTGGIWQIRVTSGERFKGW